jgi:PadR family transcriptional regulator PadR
MSARSQPVSDSPFAPLGVLEEQVVVAVLRTRGDAYGMQARREIEKATGRELSIGAVYATLDRLESKGLLPSSRVEEDGSSRRLFAVTPEGARALADTRAMRERLWRGVDLRELQALARA